MKTHGGRNKHAAHYLRAYFPCIVMKIYPPECSAEILGSLLKSSLFFIGASRIITTIVRALAMEAVSLRNPVVSKVANIGKSIRSLQMLHKCSSKAVISHSALRPVRQAVYPALPKSTTSPWEKIRLRLYARFA